MLAMVPGFGDVENVLGREHCLLIGIFTLNPKDRREKKREKRITMEETENTF